MRRPFFKIISVVLCAIFVCSVLMINGAAEGKAGDVSGDGNVDNKDVTVLFRHLNGDSIKVDDIACDTNGDGNVDNKDVVTLFRFLSGDIKTKIFYGKEEILPVVYDCVFTEWDSTVAGTFTNANQTDVSVKEDGVHLKYTGTSKTADPRITFNVEEYSKIKNKRTITGTDGSYIVIKLKSNTDGDFQVFTRATGGEYKIVSYKPDGKFHYIIADMTGTRIAQQDKLTAIRLDWGNTKTATGAEAVITEIGFFDTLEKALNYAAVIAGTDSGIVRDGTPKKYLTMSFDDATQQDLRVIQILKKYGVNKATFFINTGLCGVDWTTNVSQMLGKNVSHVRFTWDELKTEIYDGYDLESHTLEHPSMKTYDNNINEVKRQVNTDALNIFNLTGYYPAGMAWPGSSQEQTNTTRKLVYENTLLRFARGTTFQNSLKTRFKLPTEFLIWEPTCSMSNNGCISTLKTFLNKECTEDMLFYGFAHGFEFDANDSWEIFEEFIKQVSEAAKEGKIILVSNADFYQLFKDEIPAYIPAQ